MTPETACRLLDLNRAFYAAAGADFDATRRSLPAGMLNAVAALPQGPLRVLDAGCGNGRLARALEQRDEPADYVGVDADPGLLARAQEAAFTLTRVRARFLQADLAAAGWTAALGTARFDAVFCLATLHHFPGQALRTRIVRDLARCLTPGGRMVVATWQFGSSERLHRRIVPWERIGLTSADVEPGDALLPWDQGVHALRYVHAIDAHEMQQLASAAGVSLSSITFADGREGRLNLYAVLVPEEPVIHES